MPLNAMQTPRRLQLFDCDWSGGVKPTLVDPQLDPVEVDGGQFHFESAAAPSVNPSASITNEIRTGCTCFGPSLAL
jgi:hypothetical protein